MTNETFTFRYFNTDFHGEYWLKDDAKAVIVLTHGLGEHLGRFTFPVAKLLENNFSVIAFDHFGHGKTSGKKGHNPGYQHVLKSIDLVVAKAKELCVNQPVFLYGHSMGANAAINYAFENHKQLKGVIATSPFLRLSFVPPKWKLVAGGIIRKIAPSITLNNEIDPNYISRSKEEVKKYKEDPLVHARVSANYSLVFMEKGEEAIQRSNEFKAPILLLHGDDDHLTDCKGTKEFGEKAANAKVKLYEGGYHELHNDLCKEEMMKDMIAWLQSTLDK